MGMKLIINVISALIIVMPVKMELIINVLFVSYLHIRFLIMIGVSPKTFQIITED